MLHYDIWSSHKKFVMLPRPAKLRIQS